ncbi:hypothetical protein GCM10023322_05990 [Rugosimonospora acidiphila]|uniref:Phosphoglycerate mutase n=1 Tax=Rugosimonospora acidiphila TaxID=556531 RepID=A0ABP9RIV5_9ACTN
MTTVVLVRHGRTAWHQPNRYTGRSDLPLDEQGQRQAAALPGWARDHGFTTVACSPLLRARQTAAPTAHALGLAPLVDARLAELDFGDAEGCTLAEVRAADPDVADRFEADPVAGHFPGGEAPAQAAARFAAALGDLVDAGTGDAATPADAPILVIAHSTIIRLHLCAVLGLPLRDYRRRLPRLDPVAATALRYPSRPEEPVALLAFNVPVRSGSTP